MADIFGYLQELRIKVLLALHYTEGRKCTILRINKL